VVSEGDDITRKSCLEGQELYFQQALRCDAMALRDASGDYYCTIWARNICYISHSTHWASSDTWFGGSLELVRIIETSGVILDD
jgi:hypothetical protein